MFQTRLSSISLPMNTLDQMVERGHERVSFHQDPSSGLRAIIAVHSTARGPGFGGVRRWYYPTEADALYDALRLSEAMTDKAAVADIAMGGAKIVLILPRPGHRAAEAEAGAMGRIIESYHGSLVAGEDVGLTPQYVDWMARETTHVMGGDRCCPGGDPAPYTARGVINAMSAALAYTGRPADFAGLTVAIQGAGSVGASLAGMLAELGARVLIADLSAQAIRRVVEECGAEVVRPEEILTCRCDILAPCALGGVIDASIVRKLRCSIICGGANNILDDYDEDSVALKARGIVYVPDLVANAGGLIQLAGAYLGLPEDERRQRIADIEHTTMRVLRDAESAASTYAAAIALARRRIARAGEVNAPAG